MNLQQYFLGGLMAAKVRSIELFGRFSNLFPETVFGTRQICQTRLELKLITRGVPVAFNQSVPQPFMRRCVVAVLPNDLLQMGALFVHELEFAALVCQVQLVV